MGEKHSNSKMLQDYLDVVYGKRPPTQSLTWEFSQQQPSKAFIFMDKLCVREDFMSEHVGL